MSITRKPAHAPSNAPRTSDPTAAAPKHKATRAKTAAEPSPETFSPTAPKQLVTLDVPQPLSSDDVNITGTGAGWVDPAAASADGSPPVRRYAGPLFRDGPSASDVQQGQLGDCYFAAALAGLAAINPSAVERLIQPTGDGSVSVTFYERDVVTGQYRPVVIHVDPELYQSRWGGGPLYGRAPGRGDQMELWFPLVEKAWATWKGGYEQAGRGGTQNQVFSAVLGRNASWLEFNSATPDGVWGTMQATLQAGLPLGAATASRDDGRYANSGVHANHGYTVLSANVENGQRVVTLRNPWGSGEPRGDGVDDGVFTLPFNDFLRLYEQVQFPLI